MLNNLLGTHCLQEPIATLEHAQNFHIYKILVPKLPPNISSPGETSQTSLERFSTGIDRLETVLPSPSATLQISKLPTQPKAFSASLDPIKWYHDFSRSDVKEYGLSEITKSTAKSNHSKSGP